MEYTLFKTKATAMSKKYLGEAVRVLLTNLKGNQSQYKVYNILQVGKLIEGEAYYHEVDEYYRCVGFEVEIESQFEYEHNGKLVTGELEKSNEFHPVWVGKSHPVAPVTFELGYRPFGENHRFENGLGDHIEVVKEIASIEEVKAIISLHELDLKL